MIPISTAIWNPTWFNAGTRDQTKCFLDKNNVLNGIKEEALMLPEKLFKASGSPCEKECKWLPYVPNCPFMVAYSDYLKTVNFDWLMSEFKRVAEDVRKINNYTGEPIIVLMVHEKPEIVCAERPCLIKYFKDHGIKVEEWSKENSGILF